MEMTVPIKDFHGAKMPPTRIKAFLLSMADLVMAVGLFGLMLFGMPWALLWLEAL